MSNRIELENLLKQWLHLDSEIEKHYENVVVSEYIDDWKYESRLFSDVSEYIEKESTSEIYKYTDEINDLVLEKEGILLELNNLYTRREDILSDIFDEIEDKELTKDKYEIITDILETLSTSTYSERDNLISYIHERYVKEDESKYHLFCFISSIVKELDDEYSFELDENEMLEDVIENLDEDELESESEIREYIISNHAKPKEEED